MWILECAFLYIVGFFLIYLAIIAIALVWTCLTVKETPEELANLDRDDSRHDNETLSEYLARRANQIDMKNRLIRETKIKALTPAQQESRYMPAELKKHLGFN